MTNIKRASRFVSLAAMLLVAPALSYADTILIEGELTDADFVAEDSGGMFYYDLIEVVSIGGRITLTLETGDFAPFLAWGIGVALPPWPAGSEDPYDWFQGGSDLSGPGTIVEMVPGFAEGQTFLVMVATAFWNPTPLGSYTLTIDRLAATSVPEPGSLALLTMGLFGMTLARRRKQQA